MTSFPIRNNSGFCNIGKLQVFHERRELLRSVMEEAGFQRHPIEWWHFSYGDQLWAHFTQQQAPDTVLDAMYGRIIR